MFDYLLGMVNMKKTSMELTVGIFVVMGIILIGYLLTVLGGLNFFNNNDYYSLFAKFESVAGLKKGASVEMAGVQIGNVGSISLDEKVQVALVQIDILKKVKLDEDAIASVKTSGLIGDKYISLLSGGSDEMLVAGDSILQTESALDIEALLGKFVFGDVGNKD